MASSPATSDPKWRRQPEERPRQLLGAALEVFAEHGIAAAKLEDIAARAGVSKGTIYLYFQSKEDLFREVVRQLVVPHIATAEAALGAGTATEQLEKYLLHQWTHLSAPTSDQWVRLVLLELHKHPDLLAFYRREVIDRSNEVLGRILRRGMESGEFREIEPGATIRMIKALVLMHAMWCGRYGDASQRGAQPAHVAAEITEFVLHALRRVETSPAEAGR